MQKRTMALALLVPLGATWCRADQALVVGIQEYNPLVAASTLKGCVNDAKAMAAALEKDGFTVKMLLDAQATKGGILSELKRLQTDCGKEERFAFYYAGHGRKSPRYALMPSDATYNGNDISPQELNDAIAKIPAQSRTVLLDSCFSGGMAAGEMSRGLDDFTARFFDDSQERSIKFGPAPAKASQQDTPQQLDPNASICYYTASLSSEQALESSMEDSQRHGLFTYALLTNLQQGTLWGDVHNNVKKTMAKKLENSGRTQNPMISTQFIESEVLQNRPKANATVSPSKTLLDVWHQDNPDPRKVALLLRPDRDVLEAGRKVSLEVKVGQPGFLVIFGQIGDRFYQFYPSSASASAAAVKKGTVRFPDENGRLYFDSFGADHLKAMLFDTAEGAQAVLDAMQASNGKARDLVLARALDTPAVTSRLSVAVGDILVGGLRIRDLDGLIVKVLSQDSETTRFLASRMRSAAGGYPKGVQWIGTFDPKAKPSLQDREVFLTVLNLAVQESLLYEPSAFREVELPDKVMKAVKKPPKGDRLMELNRAILSALYPNEVNPDDARR